MISTDLAVTKTSNCPKNEDTQNMQLTIHFQIQKVMFVSSQMH